MTAAILGGAPVRTEPWPAWPQWSQAEADGLLAVLDSGVWGGYSPEVARFEEEFAAFVGTSRCVSMANGTLTLESALAALGVGPGQEVLVPAYTFNATASAVAVLGATPVFVDIDPATWNMDVSDAEARITARTTVVVPVHFGGHPVDLDALLPLASRHGLAVLEDAAHAHGSTWRGRPVGGIGEVGSFSFQASKNITSGEGGAITTNDDTLADKAWSHGNLGRQRPGDWYQHSSRGSNHRMIGFAATLLRAALQRYPDQLAARETAGRYLREQLADSGLVTAAWDDRVDHHSHHLLPLHYRAEAFGGLSREVFAEALQAEGIPCALGYPVSLNRQAAYGGREGECPVTDEACTDTLWIGQQLLLAAPDELADVPTAVARIRSAADQIRDRI